MKHLLLFVTALVSARFAQASPNKCETQKKIIGSFAEGASIELNFDTKTFSFETSYDSIAKPAWPPAGILVTGMISSFTSSPKSAIKLIAKDGTEIGILGPELASGEFYGKIRGFDFIDCEIDREIPTTRTPSGD